MYSYVLWTLAQTTDETQLIKILKHLSIGTWTYNILFRMIR